MDHSARVSGGSPRVHTPASGTPLEVEVFNTHLNNADAIYNSGNLNNTNKQAILRELDVAYRAMAQLYTRNQQPADFNEKATKLFFLAGKCYYNADMVKSLHSFQAAVFMSFTKLGIIEDRGQSRIWAHASIDEYLRGFQSEPLGMFTDLDTLVCHSTSTFLLEKIPPEKLLEIGRLFQNWGACCQNIAVFREANPENTNRFKGVYGFAKTCFEQFAHQTHDAALRKDARWEVASLLYNTGRFLHYLEYPGDVQGAMATLNQMLPFLEDEGLSVRAQVKRAQVHNITMIETNKLAEKETVEDTKRAMKAKCYDEVCKAVSIAEATSGFDDFLKHMFYNNKASFALEIGVTDYEMIGQCVQKATAYARSEKLNDVYYATYFINAAKLSQRQGNVREALEHLETADQICREYANEGADLQAKVKKLKDELLRT